MTENMTKITINPEQNDLCRAGDLLKNRWEICSKLGAGGFGQIYMAKDCLINNVQVAIKVEPASRKEKAQLPMELFIMKNYQGFPHAIPLYGAGTHEQINYIVMQLIGPNLARLRRTMREPQAFSLNTTIRLGIQCVEAIRDFHSLDAVHRDVKPHSWKRRYDFISEFGRKDDMVSYFYMIIEFLKGFLPWRDLSTPQDVTVSKEKYTLEKLCVEYPVQLNSIAGHINSLGHMNKPNYADILENLKSIAEQNEVDMNVTWDCESHNLRDSRFNSRPVAS